MTTFHTSIVIPQITLNVRIIRHNAKVILTIQTTLIYLELVPDPTGSLASVP